MRKIIIGLAVVFLITSCEKEKSYQMEIFIKNSTVNKLSVTLYPKLEYMHGSIYHFFDMSGGYRDTSFDIESNDQESLYISSNLAQTPFNLASKVFDSIYIKSSYNNKIQIKFSIDTVIGYSENLFDRNSSSSWIYRKNNYAFKTNFSTHPIEAHEYSFVISQ